jgi:hypothetical protein
MHRQCVRVVSRELNLYECEFYIEKTYKTYVPFYIGDLTRQAVRVLQFLSDLARADESIRGNAPPVLSEDRRQDKLFQLPKLERSFNRATERWYRFPHRRLGDHDIFLTRAIGSTVKLHPHMLRRGYAMIHHYRYENSTYAAISHRLAHLDLVKTETYIADRGPNSGPRSSSVYARLTDEQRAAHRATVAEIEDEIAVVAKARVQELVEEVITDGPRAMGGFARLILRFHQRFGQRIDYSQLAAESKADVLAKSLIEHGHAFRPMRHANCVASHRRRSRSAACYSAESKALQTENATPATCTDCPYSHWAAGHTAILRSDANWLAAQAHSAGDTLRSRAFTVELENLRKVIELRELRMNQARGKESA